MKDLGLMHYFLGLEVWQKPGEIFLSQRKYAVDVLRRFGMMDYKSMSTPMISNLKKLQDQVTGVKFTCSSESHSPGGWLRP
jgi:hypothetical protein